MNFVTGLAWLKTYFNSMASYLGIVNFLLLLLTFKNVYHINFSAWLVVPSALLLGGLVGYLDYRFVLIKQNTISNDVNNLKHQLDRIEERLK
ncbi:MAG TPA: hypothetical protein PLT65_04310 [Bacilli bacterium]|nr:hypothetical protein [Bacilli bacterium]